MNKKIIIAGAVVMASLAAAMLVLPDTTAPSITDVRAKHIKSDSAEIKWFTNEPAISKVYYSASTPVVFETAQIAEGITKGKCSDRKKKFSQKAVLSGLSPETTYYYIVESADKAGNSSSSEELNFITKKAKKAGEKELSAEEADLEEAKAGCAAI